MDSTCVIPRWQLLKQDLINLDADAFLQAVEQHKNAVLLDVRTKQEFDSGSLPGAKHLNYFSYSFLDELEQLDRSRTYFLFCRTGRRSVRAGILMKNWGFQKLVHLDGGLTALPKSLADL
ncbi:MAG: rhodanese-like domain-containing protein [Saprospiraceae bacterium]|nr:rhodanese-like domain-containing protein [Saprospiraceae bacterium]